MKESSFTQNLTTPPHLSEIARRKDIEARSVKARVVAGGSIASHDPGKPFIERMFLGGSSQSLPARTDEAKYAKAVLDSVAVNLSAGVDYVEAQEAALAGMGGNLSEIAAVLTASRVPGTTEPEKRDLQVRFDHARSEIREKALKTHNDAALFSEGTSPPVVIAAPAAGKWEGLAVDRANIGTPGMIAVETGKIHGSNPGLFLDEGSVQRALSDWRKLCLNNRMQWGMLTERLHRIKKRSDSIDHDDSWTVPPSPESLSEDGLRRPHRDN